MSRTASGDLANLQLILFDLDGTLVDTAPDMVAALVELQCSHDVEPVAYEIARSHVSNGALGLIRLAFPGASEAAESSLHTEYLDRYRRSVCSRSTLFPGLGGLLDLLDEHARPWGVVTNKPQHLTEPLLTELGLAARSACTVSGDSIPEKKPHPAPLLLACKRAHASPGNSVYIGDAARDIEAGRAAGMNTIAAAYGYVTSDDDPARWNADRIAGDPDELAQMLRKAVNLDA